MKEFEEAQKSFLEILHTIRKKVYNLTFKYNDKEISNILKYLGTEINTIEKDIKISE